jgi:hypothetical protein
MRKKIELLALAASFTGFIAMTPAFAACKGRPTFEDTFQNFDPSWGQADAAASVNNGKFVVSPSPGYVRIVLSQSDFYGDGSLCVQAAISEASSIDGTQALVAFWAVNNANTYLLTLGSDGKQGFFKVDRLSNNRWLTPIHWQTDPVIKFQLGDVNDVEVQMAGRTATILINDKKLGQFNGSPPDGGGLIGIGASASAGVTAKVSFQKFQFFNATGP